jgi:hypothetical protein
MQSNLIINSIITPDGTVLESRHKHDFNSYKDKNGLTFSVDGGNAYLRRLVGFIPSYDVLCETEIQYIKKYKISYDIVSGRFSSINGYIDNTIIGGYRQVYLGGTGDRRQYPAHRLVFYFIGVDISDMEIDHINNVRDDNMFVNLRIVSTMQNQHNSCKRYDNTSGFKGITKHKGQWVGRCQVNGVRKYTKYFDDINKCNDALMELRLTLHDNFTNHGNSTSILPLLYKENNVYDTDDWDVIRDRFKRGGRGVKGDEPLTYVKLKDMNDAWLQATIEYICGSSIPPDYLINKESQDYSPMFCLYVKEQMYREDNNIQVV